MKPLAFVLSAGLALTPLHASSQMKTPSGDSAADQAFMKSMEDMQKGMATEMTGDTDKDFVAMMIPHHQGAVEMAKIELRYGKDPQNRKLARAIVASQEKEIAEMTAWQKKHAR